MSIQFLKVYEEVRFHSPHEGMKEVTHTIERRKDPLLHHWAIGSARLKDKAHLFLGIADRELITEISEQSRPGCFFCPEHVLEMTPCYPESLIPGGKLCYGECILFPNLFPLCGIHAVIALGSKHFRELNDFQHELLFQGLELSKQFIKIVNEKEPLKKYFTVNCNYMFPAGASLVHPHLQIFGGQYPNASIARIISECRNFKEQNGNDYFSELIKIEVENKMRFITCSGKVHWITPFAPQGMNEVTGILLDCPNFLYLDKFDLIELSTGLSSVLSYYHNKGFSAFNFTIFSPAVDDDCNYFPVMIKIICRQNICKNYRTDDYFIQKFLGEEIMLYTPEDVAKELRQYLIT